MRRANSPKTVLARWSKIFVAVYRRHSISSRLTLFPDFRLPLAHRAGRILRMPEEHRPEVEGGRSDQKRLGAAQDLKGGHRYSLQSPRYCEVSNIAELAMPWLPPIEGSRIAFPSVRLNQ